MRSLDPLQTERASLPLLQGLCRKYPLLQPLWSLQYRDYGIYWLALSAQVWTYNMQLFVRAWYAFDLTERATLIGVVAVAQGLPVIFISLYGGALADRLRKRNVIVVGYGVSALAAIGLAVVIGTDTIEWWHLIVSAFVSGVGTAIASGARQSIISDLVAKGELLNAISLSSVANNLARIASPAVAGLLLGMSLGIAGVYYLISVLSVVSVVILMFLPAYAPTPRIRPQSVIRDMGEGLTYVKTHPAVLWLILTFMVSASLGMPYLHLLPVLAKEEWAANASRIGILFSMAGVGALIGSLAMASLGGFKRKGLLLLFITSGFGLGILALAFSPIYLGAILILIPLGVCQSSRISLNATLTQLQSPGELRGRIMGVYHTEMGVYPFGILGISVLADLIGAKYALAASGGILFLFCAYVLYSRPYLRNLT